MGRGGGDLTGLVDQGRRAIRGSQNEALDLDVVYNTIDKIQKDRDAKKKADREYELSKGTLDVQARNIGFKVQDDQGKLSLTPDTPALPSGMTTPAATGQQASGDPGATPPATGQGPKDPFQELVLSMQPVFQTLPPVQRKQAMNALVTEFTKKQVDKYSQGGAAGPNFDIFNLDPSVKEAIQLLPRDKQVSLFTDYAKSNEEADIKKKAFNDRVAAAGQLLDQLEELRNKILAQGIKLGPGAAKLASIGSGFINDPALGDVAAYNGLRDSTAGLVAEVIARETGKKTNEDIERAKQMIPGLDVPDANFQSKMREGRKFITSNSGGKTSGGANDLSARRLAMANQLAGQNPKMTREAIIAEVKKKVPK